MEYGEKGIIDDELSGKVKPSRKPSTSSLVLLQGATVTTGAESLSSNI